MVAKKVLIAPSILSADFARLGEAVREAEDGGADWIHVDVMDGHFVPNLTIGPPVVKSLREATGLPLDVHLMIDEPERYIDDFVAAGADWLTIHVEATVHLHRAVQQIRELGAHPGVALNPATSLAMAEEIAADIDQLLIMSVNPGFGGQEFISASVAKLASAAMLLEEAGADALLAVDGGIGPETAPAAVEAGAEVLVAGAAIFGHPPVAEAIARLREAIED